MRRMMVLVCIGTIILEPFALYAQGLFGIGAGASARYGQSTGQRRDMARQISPLAPQSFYDRAENESSLSDRARAMGQSSGGMARGTGLDGLMLQYQIHVLGQVAGPGTYRIPPSTRLDEVLDIAGGVLERGSRRRVEVRRSDGWQFCDLMRYRLRGDLNQNPFLLENDVIFVPYAKKNVEIQGPVNRSGVYELVGREGSLWDAVSLAGGFTAGAALESPLTVIRFENGEKQLLEVANVTDDLRRFRLLDGDIAIVPHILTKDRRFDYNVSSLPKDNVFYPSYNDNVFVMGAVSLPGAYPFSPNYSIRDYVQMAGPIKYSKTRDVRVLTGKDRKFRHPERDVSFHLSPGDTIIIPERAWTADNVLKWYNTLASSIITGFTLRELIRR